MVKTGLQASALAIGLGDVGGHRCRWQATTRHDQVGWALGRVLARDTERPSVVIGKDTRISGYMFEAEL